MWDTVDICLSLHSFKFASRINLHMQRKNSRINNFVNLFSEKIHKVILQLFSIHSHVIVD